MVFSISTRPEFEPHNLRRRKKRKKKLLSMVPHICGPVTGEVGEGLPGVPEQSMLFGDF